GPRRHQLAGQGQTGARARRRVLQQLPRSDRERLLHQQDGTRGPAVHGQPLRARVDGVSFRGIEEVGAWRGDRITGEASHSSRFAYFIISASNPALSEERG